MLLVATKDQLFHRQLYQKIDGVAMGSPLGPLMASTFLCSIKEKLRLKREQVAGLLQTVRGWYTRW